MKNKIFEILLIIIFVNILLIAVSFLPEINFGSSENGNSKIKFLSYNSITDFTFKDNNKNADSLINTYTDSTENNNNGLLHRRSLTGLSPKIKNNYLVNPNNDKGYALDNFFNALLKEKDNSVVRVAHYGDSQLEGDRITCYVRTYFQQKFGGSGVGFVPFDDIATNVNLERTSSANWMRYTVFHNRYGCGYYGLSGNVYKFTKYAIIKSKDDTVSHGKDTAPVKVNTQEVFRNATVSIALHNFIKYDNIFLMYGHSNVGCQMNVYNQSNHEKILSEKLEPSEKFTLHKLDFSSTIKSFMLEFSGDLSPDFYGLLIDGKNGVQVDNYSIRGHSGDGLLLLNPEYLATQLKKLNIKFVIFQYGNNVVPYVKSDKACEQMKQMYSDIFMRFKKAAPEISILVVGAGDMAYMEDGNYTSYPFIPKIRDAQKNAAIKAGCAFWDLFGVMGGSNSILTWTDKGLASHDGHFTPKGQKIIGKELFDALMVEYNQYTFRQRKKENS